MRRMLVIFLSGLAIIVLALNAIVLLHRFPFVLMDLNDDGYVSPAEYLGSIDLWYHPAPGIDGYRAVDGPIANCTVIFRLKDGYPIKTVCEQG